MGGNSYSCFTGSCTRDSSHEFSEVLSISNEEDYQCSTLNSHERHGSVSSPHFTLTLNSRNCEETKDNVYAQPLPTVPEMTSDNMTEHIEDTPDIDDSGRESPDNRSQESVMTAISPTKERKIPLLSPKRPTAVEAIKNVKTGKVDKLYLHGSENEVLGDWLELHDLIRAGNCAALATYAKQHRIDLQTVRFTDHRYSPLHLAVLYDHLEMVKFLIKEGVNVNVKDESGYTAMGIAYEQSSLQVINELFNAKAAEFADSPYSPYALSVISNALSAQSSVKTQPPHTNTSTNHSHLHRSTASADLQRAAQDYYDNVSDLDNGSVRSEPLLSAWSTPRSRSHSLDVPYSPHTFENMNMPYERTETLHVVERTRRLTVNSPADLTFRTSPVVVDSVKRRMAQLTESLDKLAQRDRQRSFSLPANSPVFASLKENRVYSPTARASLPLSAVFTTESAVAPLHFQPTHSVASDQTSHADTHTPRSVTTGDGSSVSELSSVEHSAQHKKKSMGKRLRQATGRALSMLNPVKGMPPRAPVLPGKGASSDSSHSTTLGTAMKESTDASLESATSGSAAPRTRPGLPVHTTATPVPRSAVAGIFEVGEDTPVVVLKPIGEIAGTARLQEDENPHTAAATTLNSTIPHSTIPAEIVTTVLTAHGEVDILGHEPVSHHHPPHRQLRQYQQEGTAGSGSGDSLEPVGAFLLEAPLHVQHSHNTVVSNPIGDASASHSRANCDVSHTSVVTLAEHIDAAETVQHDALVFPTDLQSPVRSNAVR